MGLDISHDAWSGSYSAFDRWRTKLAEVAGIPLNLMEGHWDGTPAHPMLPLSWAALSPDPLHVLLHHSDCDGIIEVKYLKGLAERLEQILPLLPDEDAGGHIRNWREKTQTFIDGCWAAYESDEPLEFG